jgi:hypothetical protein
VSYNYADSNSCHASASQNIYVVPCSTAIILSNLTSPSDTTCATTVTPSFTIFNAGQTNIYTSAIYYQIDNGVAQNYTWSGSLAGGHSTIVTLPAISTAPGNHVITIFSVTDTLRGSFTVEATPVVNLGADTTQCGGSITLNAQNAGALYLWSTGVTAQNIMVNQTGLYSVTVTNAQTCSAADSISVSIYVLPVVTLQLAADTVCSNGGIINLSGGGPAGGNFSGEDVANNQFDAATAGQGSYVMSYTYTDTNSCSASASENIFVEACTAIENVTGSSGISIFPNPNGIGLLQVKVAAAFIGQTVFIFDATGGMMKQYSITSANEQVDINQLSAGIYLLQVGEEFKKLVVE